MNITNKLKPKQTAIVDNKTPSPTEGPQSLEQVLFRNQVKKTQICRYYVVGKCDMGRTCLFAHGDFDLRSAPDLTKSRLCRAWIAGKCTKSRGECKFAHGRKDVNSTHSFHPRPPGTWVEDSSPGSGTHEVDVPPPPQTGTHEVDVPPSPQTPRANTSPKSDISFNDTLSTCSGVDHISSSPPSETDQSFDGCGPKTPRPSPKARFVGAMSPVQHWLKYMCVFLLDAPTEERAKLALGLQDAAPDQYYD